MPRNTLILPILLSFLLGAANAEAASCGDRVKGFNIYEEFVDGKIVEKHSTFVIREASPHSAFEGVMIGQAEPKGARLEIEVYKGEEHPKLLRKSTWKFESTKLEPKSLAAGSFQYGEIFKEGLPGDSFLLKLTADGKILCEDGPYPIYQGD